LPSILGLQNVHTGITTPSPGAGRLPERDTACFGQAPLTAVTIRRALTTLTLLAVVASTAVLASPAAAATPCWKRLVNDWYDGRIDKTYSVACYRAAIKNLPDDVDAYSDARDDIERALSRAIRNKKNVKGSDPVPPQPANGGGVAGETSTTRDDPPPTATNGGPEDETPEATGGPTDDGDDGGILSFVKPSNADSIPLPLLVLAGLALLLLALAAGGFVTRRIQARRVRVEPGPPNQP
jgi:hypothetical protein